MLSRRSRITNWQRNCLLQAESKVLSLIVGRVASETPIKSILGVIVEETAEQHFLKRNWMFSWVQDCALLQPMSKQVPWYLDDGTGRVNVAGTQGAIGFKLTVGSEVFEKSEPSSLVRGTLDYLRGFKMLGVRRIEHVLPLGTRLTVVGKAVKNSIGDVRIQNTAHHELSKVVKTAIEYFLDAYAKREERVTQGLKRQHETSSDGTDRDGDAPDLCVICLERKYNAAFVQCGHMCCCITCSMKLQGKSCPLCRTRIDHVLKIYRH